MPELMSTWPPFAFSRESAWGRVLCAFLQSSYDRSGSNHTLTHYRQILIEFFSDPAKLPDAYSREDVEAFIHGPGYARGREGRLPGPGTINNRLSCLNSFYTYCAGYTIADAEGHVQPILRVPAPTTGIRHVKRARAYHTLTVQEIERFFAVIPRDTEQGLKYRALFTTYLYTARRNSEILQLRYGDIERVTILEHGNSREAYTYAFYGKGRKRIRDTAELPQPAATAIFAYLEQSGRLKSIQAEDFLFVADTTYAGRLGYDPRRPLSPQTIWQAAKRFARAANIDEKKMNIHVWRHVSAQQRYLLGEDIFSLSQLLRHASIGTTHVYLMGLTTNADTGAKLLESRFKLL